MIKAFLKHKHTFLVFIPLVSILISSCRHQENTSTDLSKVELNHEQLDGEGYNCYYVESSISDQQSYRFQSEELDSLKLFDLIFSYSTYNYDRYQKGIIDSIEFHDINFARNTYCHKEYNYKIAAFGAKLKDRWIWGVDVNHDYTFEAEETYFLDSTDRIKGQFTYETCMNEQIQENSIELNITTQLTPDGPDMEYCFTKNLTGQFKNHKISLEETFYDHILFSTFKIVENEDTSYVNFKEPFNIDDAIYKIDSVDLFEKELYIEYLHKGDYPKFINLSLPSLVSEDHIQTNHNNKDFRLIYFWGSWCQPCIQSIPKLIAFENEFSDDIELIGVCVDNNKEDPNEVISKHNIPWSNLYVSNENDKILEPLYVYAYPTYILLDKDDNILSKTSDIQSAIDYLTNRVL